MSKILRFAVDSVIIVIGAGEGCISPNLHWHAELSLYETVATINQALARSGDDELRCWFRLWCCDLCRSSSSAIY
jgi:phosphopantetheinyl transferase